MPSDNIGLGDEELGVDVGGGGTGGAVDPAALAVEPGPEPGRRPRKQRSDAGQSREPGTRTKRGTAKKGSTTQVDLSSLHGMFVGLHAIAAMQTNTPELEVTPEEGTQFLTAAQNVLRHYSVETTQKTLDWIAFMGTTVAIYGTRGAAIMARHRAERAANVSPGRVPPPPPMGHNGGSPMGGNVRTFAPVSAHYEVHPDDMGEHDEGLG